MLEKVIKTWHINNAACFKKPKIFITTILLVIKIITKNLINKGFFCKKVLNRIIIMLGIQNALFSLIYKILTNNNYRVFKRTIKPGLKEEDKKA